MSGRTNKDQLPSWIYLGITMFVLILVCGPLYSFGIFLSIFTEYYHENHTKAGWIGSTLWFFVGTSYPVVAFLRRRFGLRPVVLCASIIVVFTFVSTPFMPTLNFLFLTYSIPFGISAGFLDCLSIITLREYFDKYLGLACGLRCVSLATGAMAFNYLLPIFIKGIGWKKTFFTLSSLGAAFVVYALAYRRSISLEETTEVILDEDKDVEASKEKSKKTQGSYRFLRNKGFLLVLAGSVLFITISLAPAIFIIRHAKSLGYPLSRSKWTLVIHSFSSLLGRAGIGRIADIAMRHQKVKFITPTAVMLFGISCGLCSLTQSLHVMTLYMGLIGCNDGIFWVVLPLMVLEVTNGENGDYAYSFLVFVSSFGCLTGPPAMGWLYDVTGDFSKVLYAVSACAITGGVIMTIGACVTSRGHHASSQTREKGARDCVKTNELNYFISLGSTINPILQEDQALSVVEYESAV